MIVLDSVPLVAFFRHERGNEVVRELLDEALSTGQHLYTTELNYAEVKYVLTRELGTGGWEQAAAKLRQFPIVFIPVDRALADIAADLKAFHALSLPDACAAALAITLNGEVLTADKEFQSIQDKVRVRWFR